MLKWDFIRVIRTCANCSYLRYLFNSLHCLYYYYTNMRWDYQWLRWGGLLKLRSLLRIVFWSLLLRIGRIGRNLSWILAWNDLLCSGGVWLDFYHKLCFQSHLDIFQILSDLVFLSISYLSGRAFWYIPRSILLLRKVDNQNELPNDKNHLRWWRVCFSHQNKVPILTPTYPMFLPTYLPQLLVLPWLHLILALCKACASLESVLSPHLSWKIELFRSNSSICQWLRQI